MRRVQAQEGQFDDTHLRDPVVTNGAQVRCDSTSSEGNAIETCSNCRRLKQTCQFERAPMKRGPSKGYIVYDPERPRGA